MLKNSQTLGNSVGLLFIMMLGKSFKRLVGDKRAQEGELWIYRRPQIADRKLHMIRCGWGGVHLKHLSLFSISSECSHHFICHWTSNINNISFLHGQQRSSLSQKQALSLYGKEKVIWKDRIYENVKSHSVLELQRDGNSFHVHVQSLRFQLTGH